MSVLFETHIDTFEVINYLNHYHTVDWIKLFVKIKSLLHLVLLKILINLNEYCCVFQFQYTRMHILTADVKKEKNDYNIHNSIINQIIDKKTFVDLFIKINYLA